MDTKKIGTFTSMNRKKKGYTQGQLAEKLGVTIDPFLAEESGKQGNQSDTDEGHAATGHELLHRAASYPETLLMCDKEAIEVQKILPFLSDTCAGCRIGRALFFGRVNLAYKAVININALAAYFVLVILTFINNDFLHHFTQKSVCQFFDRKVLADNAHKLFSVYRGFLCLVQFALQGGGSVFQFPLPGFVVCGHLFECCQQLHPLSARLQTSRRQGQLPDCGKQFIIDRGHGNNGAYGCPCNGLPDKFRLAHTIRGKPGGKVGVFFLGQPGFDYPAAVGRVVSFRHGYNLLSFAA